MYEPSLDSFGREVPDPTPVEYPLRFTRTKSLFERQREMLLNFLRQQKEDAEYETFEDANDFDVVDDLDVSIHTPYELDDDIDFRYRASTSVSKEDSPESSGGTDAKSESVGKKMDDPSA